MAGIELFANQAQTTVSSGGTTAPSSGTSESWTVSSSSGFPSASSTANPPTFFRVTDPSASSEKMIVTNVSGTTWTVTRGAEGTSTVAHSSGFAVQHVVTAAALAGFTQQTAAGAVWENVLAHGADPTGSSDSSTAFNNAYAALPSEGGVVYVPRGNYKITSGVTMSLGNNQTVVIQGDGAQATKLSHYGSGDCLRVYNALAYGSGGATSYFSGVKGMTIDGTNATGTSPVGLHAGDITSFQTRDLVIENFTGTSSIGMHLDNTVTWTEEGDFRAIVSNCTRGVVLDVTTGTNSYGYSCFDLTFFQAAAQSCFCVLNGAFFYHGDLRIRGDVNGSSTALTGNPAVIYVAGVGPSGSQSSGAEPGIVACRMDVLIEPNNLSGTANNLMQTLYLDNAVSFGYVNGCYGMLDFGHGTGSFTPISVGSMAGNGTNFSGFSGIISGDSNLNPSGSLGWSVWGNGTILNYLPQITTFNGFFPTAFADTFFTTLTSSDTVHLNYSGVSNGDTLPGPQRKLFFIQQPSSGGPYTLTWPSTGSPTTASPTVVWPGGNPPVLQTAASATDVIELITWDGATWFGRQILGPGVPDAEQYITLTSAYTLTSQTAAQKLFNSSTNGALTVQASTAYYFECFFTLSSMSSTSGSFGFALGGTATLTSQVWETEGNKATLATAASAQNTVSTAANTAIVTATTATVGWAKVWGKVRVNAAGTLIPQVSLGVAAAAVVGADSYFRIWPAGPAATTTAGNWS